MIIQSLFGSWSILKAAYGRCFWCTFQSLLPKWFMVWSFLQNSLQNPLLLLLKDRFGSKYQLVQWAHAATKSQRFFSTGSSSTSSSWFSSWTWSLCNFRDNFQRRTDLQSTKLETERRLSIQKSIPARAWAKMATENKSPKKKSIAFHEFFKPKLQKKGISSSNAVTSASFWHCFVLNFQKVRHPHVKQQTHPVTRNETRLTNLAAL